MRIEIRGPGVALTDARRDHVERHLYFALGRFSGQVKQVQVRLGAENGPKRGVDKTCHIVVQLLGLPTVIVKQTSADLLTAVNVAFDRAGRTVARRIDRALTSRAAGDQDEKEREEP